MIELFAGIFIGLILSSPSKNKKKIGDSCEKCELGKPCESHCKNCREIRTRTMTPGMKCEKHEDSILVFG